MTGGFPSQKADSAESVSVPWRHQKVTSVGTVTQIRVAKVGQEKFDSLSPFDMSLSSKNWYHRNIIDCIFGSTFFMHDVISSRCIQIQFISKLAIIRVVSCSQLAPREYLNERQVGTWLINLARGNTANRPYWLINTTGIIGKIQMAHLRNWSTYYPRCYPIFLVYEDTRK